MRLPATPQAPTWRTSSHAPTNSTMAPGVSSARTRRRVTMAPSDTAPTWGAPRNANVGPCRCRPSDAPQTHPDWPRNPERYVGLRDEDVLELEEFLARWRHARSTQEAPEHEGPGEVYLVGTGPGDPGLLTLRALQLMQSADVVLYDRLVSDDILRLVGPQARMVYVGKHSGFHTRSQEEIHALLFAFAEAGATVIRLKGGDPYVFGRGGEEVQYLAGRGIQVHCVPGITAASGICGELGIPMTHRGVATSVRFLTGHARDGAEQELLDSTVAGAADPHTTLVVYMGLQTLPKLYQHLSQHGMPADVPAVAVERGTTRRQRVVWGPVAELPARASAAGLKSPTLIIIGQVVALAPGWQQWEAAGRPIATPTRPPRHNYTLPQLDVDLLQQSTALSQAVSQSRAATAAAAAAAGQPAAAEEEVIRTRDVLPPAPAMRTPPRSSRSASAVLERSPSPAPALPASQTQQGATATHPLAPTAARPQSPPAWQPATGADQEVQAPREGGRQSPAPEAEGMSAGCGGEDMACELPSAAPPQRAVSEPRACGTDDESCPLFP